MPVSLPNDQYTVGWVCALPTELVAAKAMLDEEHEGPQTQPQKADENSYLLGRVGKFNVVVACLPKNESGSSSAATVAKDMLFTFPSIRFGLMVGTGAGIPDYESDEVQDVRLGDIVVSSSSENGGVIAYDFGKRLSDGSFKSMYPLNAPPRCLKTALARAETEHMMSGSQIGSYIEQGLERFPALRRNGWIRPKQASDRLFQSEYTHVGGRTCAKCDKDQEVDREDWERYDEDPVIHYGTIATGSAVVEHAPTRADIGKAHQAICLEMEAAGLMNSFPCLVIRGISDYADSHKNDIWKNYAAAVAAAYAKELLQYVTPKDVDSEPTAQKILNLVSEDLSSIKESVSVLSSAHVDNRHLAILDWISSHDFSAPHNDILRHRIEGSCLWFLETDEMKHWLQNGGNTLFCPGIPGAGKTVMAATIIEHLESTLKEDSKSVLAYIYCSYQPKIEQSIENMLQVLLRQVTAKQRSTPEHIQRLYNEYVNSSTRPPLNKLLDVLRQSLGQYNRVFIVLDAVDEHYVSNYESNQILLSELSRIQNDIPINLLMTSRFNNTHVTSKFPGSVQKEIRAQQHDMLLFLNSRLSMFKVNVTGNTALAEQIQSMVLSAADGMFLLARLHTRYLMMEPSIGFLKRALENLPSGPDRLTNTYLRAISDIDRQADDVRGLARKALAWLAHSRRALSPAELQHALAVESGMSDLDEDFLVDVDILHNLCAGLIVWDRETDIIRLIHYTTHDFLQSDGILHQPESQVALNCLSYMSFDSFLLGRCRNPESYVDRHERYPLYLYCTQHWGDHARASGSDEVKEVGLRFLEDVGGLSAAGQSMKGPSIKGGKALDSENSLKYTTCRITPAHVCASFGLTKWLQVLLEDGADVDAKDSKGDTPLTWAARGGHEHTVKFLMPKMSHEVILKDSALEDAAGEGHEADVKFLLSDSGRSEMTEERKQSALERAAQNGHIQTIKLLLEQGAKPEYQQISEGWFTGNSPLEEAVDSGNLEAVHLLLPSDGGTISEDTNRNQNLVYKAVSKSNEELVKLLLSHGADPDLVNKSDRTPFMTAVEHDEKDIALLLLSKDINVNAEDQMGCTPLISSIRSGYADLVDTLLTKGANPNLRAKTWKFQTPLSSAISRGYFEIVQTLLLRGADPNQPSGSLENPPLCVAAENDNENIVKLLLEHGAELNLPNKAKETPLFLALKEGNTKIVNLLLGRGARHDSQDIAGNTALFYAVQLTSTTVAADLISRGCDPNEKNELEETPLFYASRAGSLPLVQLLLTSGAHADPKNKLSETPLLQAAAFLHGKHSYVEYYAIIKLLLENGADPNPLPNFECPPVLFSLVRNSGVVSLWAKSEPEKLQRARGIWPGLEDFSEDLFEVFCGQLPGNTERNSSIKHSSWSARRAWKDGQETPLIWAIRAGCVDLCQYLVDLGLDDTNVSSSEPLTYKAPGFGHNSDLEVRVQNVEPEERGTIGKLAFLSAVGMGNLDILPILHRHSLSYLSETTRVGDFALLVASRRGNIDSCRYLLDAGFNIHHHDGTGKTSLSFAVIEGHDDLIQILLERGSQVDIQDETSRTPLLWATQLGNTTGAEILLRAGANPNCLDDDDRTPLLFSTINGDDTMVDLLLESGANADFTNAAGESALVWAVAQTYDRIVNVLLKRGATLVNEDDLNQSPLFWLIRPPITRIKKNLKVQRPSYNMRLKKRSGETIFSVVSRVGFGGQREFDGDETVGKDVHTMLRLLISHGQNVDLKANGRTCLARAAFQPNEDYAKLFLQYGAEPNTKTELGETTLFLASKRRNAKMIGLLSANGADPNLGIEYGRSPLMTAASLGALETTRALLKIPSVNRNLEDDFGRTAYQEASERGYIHICSLMDSDDLDIDLTEPEETRQETSVTCDVCEIALFNDDEYNHCDICHSDNFDVCDFCHRNGATCLDETHSFSKRTATSRKKAEAPKSKEDISSLLSSQFASMMVNSIFSMAGGSRTDGSTSPVEMNMPKLTMWQP